MSTNSTRPAALRLTDHDRERLLAHGGTVRAAVLALLDTADEHATCKAPKGTRRRTAPTTTVQQAAASTVQRPAATTSYAITVAGEVVYRTTDRVLADKRARMEQLRRPADPVVVVTS